MRSATGAAMYAGALPAQDETQAGQDDRETESGQDARRCARPIWSAEWVTVPTPSSAIRPCAVPDHAWSRATASIGC